MITLSVFTIFCEYIATIVASDSKKNQHDYIFAKFKIHLCWCSSPFKITYIKHKVQYNRGNTLIIPLIHNKNNHMPLIPIKHTCITLINIKNNYRLRIHIKHTSITLINIKNNHKPLMHIKHTSIKLIRIKHTSITLINSKHNHKPLIHIKHTSMTLRHIFHFRIYKRDLAILTEW